ncbi:hypothetical protein [Halorhabdus rudnickae]|uniref:hypothetical protein n=1 Tax=Halorhabdus rudnickae TaxID=1775544 RepID=UPI00108235E5|nr:hypothetical protein [Halorhabdus rudnickae]
MVTDLLLVPPVAFGVFLLMSLIIDRVGDRISNDRDATGGSFRTAWASGEDPPAQSARPNYRLYHVGIGFTIVHVAVLLVATMPTDLGGAVVGLPLLAVVGLSLFALLDSGRPSPGR